jgi:hypothetical protein
VATCGQKTVESLLVHLAHVQESVGGFFGKGSVLDVFAKNACALLFAASEKVTASVTVRLRLVVVFLVVETLWHRFLLLAFHKENLPSGKTTQCAERAGIIAQAAIGAVCIQIRVSVGEELFWYLDLGARYSQLNSYFTVTVSNCAPETT